MFKDVIGMLQATDHFRLMSLLLQLQDAVLHLELHSHVASSIQALGTAGSLDQTTSRFIFSIFRQPCV